jgi:hypothetical protein
MAVVMVTLLPALERPLLLYDIDARLHLPAGPVHGCFLHFE